MKKILAFGASNSRRSINKQLATWAADQISDAEITLIDLNDFDMPVYSIDREKEGGIPAAAERFRSLVGAHDGLLVSFAEHNGGNTVAYKNVLDWTSRLEGTVWQDKPMLCLSTSPGGRGASSSLAIAAARIPFMGGHVAAQFSLPKFKENFSPEGGILNEALRAKFAEALAAFEAEIERLMQKK